MRRRLLVRKVLLQQREEHGVLPLAGLQVRLALQPLAHEPRALGVRDRALVEAVDLELDPVESKVDEQVTLEAARHLVAEPPPAEARMDREASGLGDPAALVASVEPDAARSLTVDLDHEPAERVGLALGALDLGEHLLV